ncbi:SAM-dependent methyltransferase [Actinomadura fibrosa]|uniref:SAM-dependent methyltransferase n=1 Tax=Actinomadura fibrosa TaxID=111802 RepID=A0ABW2XSX7_9ACTN|nr:SAM-dependent methyltransferase [Actinomadura fibrosa]
MGEAAEVSGQSTAPSPLAEATDWYEWHEIYKTPDPDTVRRLAVIRARVHDFLDRAPQRPLRLVSICAGQGAELLPALASHPRGGFVEVHMLESDARNGRVAEENTSSLGLGNVRVHITDAGEISSYVGMLPADFVLLSGLFSNLRSTDVHRAVRCLPCLCRPGAEVVWTCRRGEPDLVPSINGWFDEEGFDLIDLTPPSDVAAVGTHRYTGTETPSLPQRRIFDFVGRKQLEAGG